MIYGYCRTNLDEANRFSWPTQFCAVPRIGERVQSLEGGYSSCLKVVGITYKMVPDPTDFPSDGSKRNTVSGIEVELNK